MTITSIENYEKLINEVLVDKNQANKTSLDYRRLNNYYDIIKMNEETKLIFPFTNSENSLVKY